MFNFSKVFFSESRAKKFCESVNGQLWVGLDAFDQTIYTVKYN